MVETSRGVLVRTLGTFCSFVWLVYTGEAHAAGSCGSGGELGDQVEVDFSGSVYYVTTPDGYTGDTPIPLIIGLHGDEGDPARSVNWFWRDVPDGSFIFVAPKAPNEGGSWYAERESNSAWMDELLASLQGLYNIDLDRTYIWGLSGGAVFSSRYILTRQDVFAAAQFNMGGSGGPYVAPSRPECRIPARFVVSDTDFLHDSAERFYNELTAQGHQTEWVAPDCEDHCWGDEESEGIARDWLLSFTLCGATPTTNCDGEPVIEPDPIDEPDPPSGRGGSDGSSMMNGDEIRPPAPGGAGSGESEPPKSGDPASPSSEETAGSEDGCSCRQSPGQIPQSGHLALFALLLGVVWRRRGRAPLPSESNRTALVRCE